MEKILRPALGKFHPGMSAGAPGCEFSVNESTVCIKYGVF